MTKKRRIEGEKTIVIELDDSTEGSTIFHFVFVMKVTKLFSPILEKDTLVKPAPIELKKSAPAPEKVKRVEPSNVQRVSPPMKNFFQPKEKDKNKVKPKEKEIVKEKGISLEANLSLKAKASEKEASHEGSANTELGNESLSGGTKLTASELSQRVDFDSVLGGARASLSITWSHLPLIDFPQEQLQLSDGLPLVTLLI